MILLVSGGCTKKELSELTNNQSVTKSGASISDQSSIASPVFANGADVSWESEMASAGYKFYNSDRKAGSVYDILKSKGINAIRLRVWVNPTVGGWNSPDDALQKAIKANAAGMRILIDFHYSNTWADPGHQVIPSNWSGQTNDQLKSSLAKHTSTFLMMLKNNHITPEWVQVGNETNNGMLWPNGMATTNMSTYASFINAGYDAVKSVFPNTKVIVHLASGEDNGMFRWMFDGLKANNAKYDIIGLSLYPEAYNWRTLNAQCLANMKDMIVRYGTKIMICETGMVWNNLYAGNPFLNDLLSKVKSLGTSGLGVFYWEPECYHNWQGYTKGAFDNNGSPSLVLDAFKGISISPDPTATLIVLGGNSWVTPLLKTPGYVLTSRNNDGNFEGYLNLPNADHYGGDALQLVSVSDGTEYGWGSNNSTISLGGGNLWLTPSPSYMKVNANLNNLTIAYTPAKFYITGDNNGWSTTATPMNFNASTNQWVASNVKLNAGNSFQFTANGSYNLSYKINNSNSLVFAGPPGWAGNNIPVSETGLYTIILDVSNGDGNYKYSIKK